MILKNADSFKYDDIEYVVLTTTNENSINYYYCGSIDEQGNPDDILNIFYTNNNGQITLLNDIDIINNILPKFQKNLESEIKKIMNEKGETII